MKQDARIGRAEMANGSRVAPGPVNFDRMARAYRWLEYGSFGTALEKTRLHFLHRLTRARHALVLGDGDGRFLANFLEVNSRVRVDAVDSSGVMLHLLERRIRAMGIGAHERMTIYRGDALRFTPREEEYDLVVAHFFLDCFSEAEVEGLMRRLSPHLVPGAMMLVSDFAIPKSRVARPVAGAIVGALYRAFGMITGLRVRKLPQYDAVLARCGLRIVERRRRLFGLLVSELWEFRGVRPVEATGGARADSQGG